MGSQDNLGPSETLDHEGLFFEARRRRGGRFSLGLSRQLVTSERVPY